MRGRRSRKRAQGLAADADGAVRQRGGRRPRRRLYKTRMEKEPLPGDVGGDWAQAAEDALADAEHPLGDPKKW